MSPDAEQLYLAHRGTFRGHGGWVTKIAVSPSMNNLLVTASRDKRMIVWKVSEEDGFIQGYATSSLEGHNHFVSDCVLSNDSRHVISSSWDNYLKLWDVERCHTKVLFRGHTDNVLSVGFSCDNRQIFSSCRGGNIILWNIMGQPKFKFDSSKNSHSSSVNSLSLCSNPEKLYMASGGDDKTVRLCNLINGEAEAVYHGHYNSVQNVHMFSRGTHIASGGKDGIVNVWDNRTHTLLGSAQLPDPVSQVRFHPFESLLAVASGSKIFVFDLKDCQDKYLSPLVDPTDTENQIGLPHYVKCSSLAWSRDGRTTFGGYTDGCIRAFTLEPKV